MTEQKQIQVLRSLITLLPPFAPPLSVLDSVLPPSLQFIPPYCLSSLILFSPFSTSLPSSLLSPSSRFLIPCPPFPFPLSSMPFPFYLASLPSLLLFEIVVSMI